MSTHQTSTFSDYIENKASEDWLTRFGKHLHDVADAFGTGVQAAHDYRKFAANVGCERASRLVFEKHFSK